MENSSGSFDFLISRNWGVGRLPSATNDVRDSINLETFLFFSNAFYCHLQCTVQCVVQQVHRLIVVMLL